MPPTDTSLRIRGALTGSADDVEWTIARLTPMLLAQARYRMRGRVTQCQPEDVVAHAWQITLPRLGDLTARDGRFAPVLVKFLATAVVLRVNELLRAASRRAMVAGSAGSAALAVAVDPAAGPWTQVLQRERAGAVQQALDALPADDREVVVLRLVEQQPAAVVAELLGLTANAVNVRLHRALARLRTALPANVADDLAADAGD